MRSDLERRCRGSTRDTCPNDDPAVPQIPAENLRGGVRSHVGPYATADNCPLLFGCDAVATQTYPVGYSCSPMPRTSVLRRIFPGTGHNILVAHCLRPACEYRSLLHSDRVTGQGSGAKLLGCRKLFMAVLCNGGPLYFCPVVSFYLLSFYLSFFFSPNLSGHRLDVYFYTWRGPSANLECRSEMCCTRLAANAGAKSR